VRSVRDFFAKWVEGVLSRDAASLALGALTAQALNLLAMPVLSRLYSPEDFGLFSVFMAVSGVVATAITLRYETTIVIPKSDREAVALVILSFMLVTILGVPLALLAHFLTAHLPYLSDAFGLGAWLSWAIGAGALTSLIAINNAWLTRLGRFHQISRQRVALALITILLGISWGLFDISTGLLLAQICALFSVCVYVMWYMSPLANTTKTQELVGVFKQYIKAPKFLLPVALLDVITMQLPLLLISVWYGSELAGHFGMAWRVTALPMTLVGVAVGQVFFQQFSKAWPDALAAKKLLFKTWKSLAWVGLAPMLFLLFWGREAFAFCFGGKWEDAGAISSVIAPLLFASLLHSPTSTASIVLGLHKRVLLLSIAVLVYRPLCFYIGYLSDSLYTALYLFVCLEIFQILVFQRWILRSIEASATNLAKVHRHE
jgi:O-antigen/teichoic acid export membrane protein